MSKVILNNFKASGTLTAAQHKAAFGNAIVSINTPGDVLIKDSVFDEPAYNAIEIGLAAAATPPSNVTIKNVDFSAGLTNNAITIFATQDDAVITIEDCHFASVSNALRLSNRTNAKNVQVYIKNCTVDQWEATPEYAGFLLLQDYTSASAEDFIEKSPFAPDKLAIHFQNLKHGEQIVTPEDLTAAFGCHTADQIGYMYIDKASGTDRMPAFDADIYPAITFE